MFLGIDLGTSGVKAILVDADDRILGQATAPLSLERPRPGFSEQDPAEWWRAADRAVRSLGEGAKPGLAGVRAIGLSGQMHGATLLDAADRVLRPAILWNDARSEAACGELERRAPDIRRITGNLVMPGFTAPKLVWVAEHEPDVFARIAKVLLPKDYLRLRLSGDHASEMSDAAGTLWLDVAERRWSEALVAATGLSPGAMPTLFEGSEVTGGLRAEVAREWGMAPGTPIAGGGGDQAAGAVGAGVVAPGRAFLALGTSGVYFVAGDRFAPDPDQAVHAFCHALPNRWHQMSVILSAASCLTWLARLTGARDEAALLGEMEAEASAARGLVFLPYLSGERTPHNDAAARGVFFGLDHDHRRGDLARAVLEGVAFALADGQRALLAAAARIDSVSVIGGGARSRSWGRILATALDRSLDYVEAGEVGPAFGAARLARLAVDGGAPEVVCPPPPLAERVEPDPAFEAECAARYATYRRLYPALRDLYPRA